MKFHWPAAVSTIDCSEPNIYTLLWKLWIQIGTHW